MDLILISMIPWLCIFDRFEDFTSSVTHSWSHSKTLHSSSVGQLKQLHSFWIYPVTDQTFRCCNSNILSLLKKIDWSIGHRNKQINLKPCFFCLISNIVKHFLDEKKEFICMCHIWYSESIQILCFKTKHKF